MIAIGSTNPAKVAAVKAVFGKKVKITPMDVSSGVSEQPIGDDETVTGAINRAKQCLLYDNSVNMAIGLEGGVMETSFGMMVINWGALALRDGQVFIASGARTILPVEIASMVRNGRSLGVAMDVYTKRIGVSKSEGAMGVITNGRINRDEMFSHVVKALLGQYEFYHSI